MVPEDEAAAEVRRRYGVPEAIRLRADGREVLAWTDGAEDAVLTVASDPDGLPRGGPRLRGRAALARLDSPLGPLVVRECRKGGLLRFLRGRRFHGRFRPLDELVLDRRCLGAGVPVPEAVGAVVLKAWHGWRGFLLTREVEAAEDLESWLYGRCGATSREVLLAAGRAVRRLHDAGVSHADLHAKNLLLDARTDPARAEARVAAHRRAGPGGAAGASGAAGARVLVLDLDRARTLDGPLPDEERLRNLVRLGRGIEKHRLRGMEVSRRAALRFLEGYAGSAEEGAAWLVRVRARLARGLRARILWWRLTGQARRSRAARPRGLAGATSGGAAA